MGEIGHKFESAFPITIVCPFLKESVLETFSRTSINLGEDFGIIAKSDTVRQQSGLKWNRK